MKGDFITIPTGPFAGQLGEVAEVRERVAILRVGNLNVEIDRSIFDAVTAEEDEEEEGAEKIRRTQRDKGEGEERGNKIKPRSRQKQELPPPTQQTEKIKIKKEEKEKVKKIETQIQPAQTKPQTQPQPTPSAPAPARVQPLYCAACPPDDQPKTRRRPTDLVCGDCYRQYTNEAAIALARGKVVNIFEWVVEKAPAMLAALEEQYATAKAEVETLQQVVREEVYQNLKRTTGGRQVPREVWNQAFRTQQQNLWRSKGGNARFARMKGLEGRIALLKGILEKANEPKPVVPPVAIEPPVSVVVEPPTPIAEETPPSPAKKPRKPRQPQTSKKAEAKKE